MSVLISWNYVSCKYVSECLIPFENKFGIFHGDGVYSFVVCICW